MTNELNKRILTSIFLILLLISAFLYSFILIILLLLISVISWIEFNGLINKIVTNSRYFGKVLRLILSAITLIYILYFSAVFFIGADQFQSDYKLNILYILLICIFSDIGGYIFGKFFKGKKLSKISPNKTYSGTIGSFILPITLIPIFIYLSSETFSIFNLFILAIIVSLVCQLGDLFISYLKRKAKVKDTGDLLPGHGGILDRIDGIIFALPFGINLLDFLKITI